MTYDKWKTTDPADADYMPEPDEPTELDLVYEANRRLTTDNAELRVQLVKCHAVLEQCQDCIRGETPEDMTTGDAREDTLSKIREVLLSIAFRKD